MTSRRAPRWKAPGLWLLGLVCVSTPAWGSDEEDGGVSEEVLQDLGWDLKPDDTVSKEDCAFAPGGELWRLHGTSSGWARSSGMEGFALRREGQTVLRFGQAGPSEFSGEAPLQENQHWKVRCKPGRIDIVTPAAQLTLKAGAHLEVDPRISRALSPGSREPDAAAVQSLEEVLDALASDLGPRHDGKVSGLREALARARLLNAERALAAGNFDAAGDKLRTVPEVSGLPPLASWASALTRQLEALRAKPPLMAARARRVGTLLNVPPPLSADEDPVLFWRGPQLCVRQEDSGPPRMRCVEARTGRWGKVEPYRSPHGEGWRIEFEDGGAAGALQLVWTVSPEGERNSHGDWFHPVIVARGQGDQLAVVSGRDPREHEGVEAFDFAAGPGSLVAGGGRYYFSRGDELRSLKVEGQTWTFVIPEPGGEVRCLAPPRVSPDGRWAACAVHQKPAEAGTSTRYDLLVFGLVPRAR